MKYAIRTFGCRVNQADSFEIEEGLRARGASAAPADEADVVVVNTCTVTGAADQGARSLIRRIARRNASARIIVTGCYATRAPEALASMPGVVRLVANDGKAQLVMDLCGHGDGDGPCGSHVEPGVMGRTAYPLRVQTGCEERCAFCVIPSTRGSSRSRPLSDVLAGVDRLAAAGYKELWLVGVHLGSYGRDLAPPSSLVDLLRALDTAPGDLSFRTSSLEPMDCAPEVVDVLVKSGRFAPHLHLPLQHGSDRVLAAMRRPYSVAACRKLFDDIRARLPHASIGTDVIAGFPDETDADAAESERAVEAMPLSYLHVFPYSDRPGTAASAMTSKVAPALVKDRSARLRDIGARLSSRFIRSQVGTTRPGLTLDDGTTVLTDNFLKVAIPPGLARNVRVRVRIDTDLPVLTGRVT
ncbi:MAG: MiaB/RimO family radical SAM methylthiotransferase [Vicinamibacterales bacterium]